jgi:hypothetical protein
MKTRPTTIRIAVPEASIPLEIAGYSSKKCDVSSKKHIHAHPCNRDSHGDKCPKIPSSCFFPDRKR